VVLRDAPLLDATGKRVRLAQDVIGNRIALVNFIYTTCTTVCPVSSASFQQLQQKLGPRLGKEVVLVSVTVDPLRDTPQRLREYAARYEAREGWAWLTGAKPDVDSVLKGLGAYSARFEDHPAMVLIGDARGGPWTRFFGFPSVDELMARIETIHLARKE
jgi:protein SCO1/2